MKFLTYLLFALVFIMSCTVQRIADETTTIDPDIQRVKNTVTKDEIKKHIFFLASDEMAGRNTPSQEQDLAAQYLASQLMGYGIRPAPGYDSYFQDVPMWKITPPKEGWLASMGDTLRLDKDYVMITKSGLKGSYESVFVGRGTDAELEGLAVEDKICIAICGYEGDSSPQVWFQSAKKKRAALIEKGAAGLIEIYASSAIPFSSLVKYLSGEKVELDQEKGKKEKFMHAWLNTSNEDLVRGLKEEAPSLVAEVAGHEVERFTARNIVGVLEGNDPSVNDEYIIYSGHYDHIGTGRLVDGDSIYNGARDNSVGVTTVLSAAHNLSKYPVRRSSLFIFFTGEEKGLLGSEYYADHPRVPLEQIKYCFNSDNAGYNDTTRITVFGLGRTGADPYMIKAGAAFGLDVKPDEAPEQNLFDRSDNVNFARKGIPAPTFSMGFGSFDKDVLKYYHMPADEPASLDYDYLLKFFRSYIYACRMIADTDSSLFWKEGDKYYDAGIELYGDKYINE